MFLNFNSLIDNPNNSITTASLIMEVRGNYFF